MEPSQGDRLERSLAASGSGPLLQRDYWAVIRDCELAPSEFGALLAARFAEIAPEALTRFERIGEASRALEVGDDLSVHIRMAGTCAVRVLHANANSITLCTLHGHPEAGRITFGAYRDERGDVVFHIRSRARASTSTRYAGFLAVGQPMQTMTWTDFIDRLANTVGHGVVGCIHEETVAIDDRDDDESQPTFLAKGD